MDGFEEKKWFVYIGDHHEGPFSLADIQGKIGIGQVSSNSYVWEDGMADWKLMTEVSAFGGLLGKGEVIMPPAMAVGGPDLSIDVASIVDDRKEPTHGGGTPAPVLLHDSPEIRVRADESSYFPPIEESLSTPPQKRWVKWLKGGLFLALPVAAIGAYTQGYLDSTINSPAAQTGIQATSELIKPHLLKLAEKYPTLNRWISPIPQLDDVIPEDYEGLRAAASTDLTSGGPKVALALSQATLSKPSFYVSSNLPDGAQFDIFILGVPDSLLNQLSYNSVTRITLSKKLGKSEPLLAADKSGLQPGQYNIFVTETETEPPVIKSILAPLSPANVSLPSSVPKGSKVVATKSYFLGGKKDATYSSRLKEFHDRLRARAEAELIEVKQHLSTLEKQFQSTNAQFNFLRSGKLTPLKKRSWTLFHTQWVEMFGQMKKAFDTWTPTALRNDFFYGMLFQLTQQAGNSVMSVHDLENSFVSNPGTDRKSFEIQMGQSLSLAQNAILALKTKVEQAEKIPPTPNGMPRREGL